MNRRSFLGFLGMGVVASPLLRATPAPAAPALDPSKMGALHGTVSELRTAKSDPARVTIAADGTTRFYDGDGVLRCRLGKF